MDMLEMPPTFFHQRAEAMRQRVRTLYRKAFATPCNPALLVDACKELEVALEVVQTAETILQRQYNALADQVLQVHAELAEYQSLFEDAPDAYLITSPDGTIRKANRSITHLFGMEPKLLIGRSLGMLVVEGNRRPFYAALTHITDGEQRKDWRLPLQRHNGEYFTASATVTCRCTSQGKPVTLRWQLRDTPYEHNAR